MLGGLSAAVGQFTGEQPAVGDALDNGTGDDTAERPTGEELDR